MLLLAARSADAGVLTLTWTASPEPDVAGYVVSIRASSGYADTIDVGSELTFRFSEPNSSIPYSLSVRAYNSDGLMSATSEVVESVPLIPAPSAMTLAPASIVSTGATLNGSATPNGASTTAYFEYGLTTAYGASTVGINVGAGTQAVLIGNGRLTGLTCNTVYHYRAAATNEGGSAQGADLTFTTSPCDGQLPPDFSKTLVVAGLRSPTAMATAPDGRLFVSEREGSLRVVRDGELLATPFVSLTVDRSGERGLLGVAVDPAFAQNRFVYVYYTATVPTIHNRVSRFTANGDVAEGGSETVIVDLDPVGGGTVNNGGAIAFGTDGMLYVGVGDNGVGTNAQSLTNRFGKVLRVVANGAIPTDNPFYAVATGANRAIWSLGLRQPSSIAFQAISGQMFINDEGSLWEEINAGARGANHGWAPLEGETSTAGLNSPLHTYDDKAGCAIGGGAFHDTMKAQFPMQYWGGYFFADRCGAWIRFRSPSGAVSDFASELTAPVDLKMSADGSLYVLGEGPGSAGGVVERIEYRPTGAIVDLTVNGRDEAVTHAPADPFEIAVSFDPKGSGVLTQADVFFGVSTPFGQYWLDPLRGFIPTRARLYSGALGALQPTVVFRNRGTLPSGPYIWFVIIRDPSALSGDGQIADMGVTLIR